MSGFLDEVRIDVAAGRGGRGAVSFRREKYVPNGGPDGGDGGRGGSVTLVADSEDSTLSSFHERRRFAAHNGGDGATKRCTGAAAADIRLSVPAGTVVRDDATGDLLADLDHRGAEVVVAAGGRGGRGNARFATSTRQAPRIGELGTRGEARRLHLELKLIADVGLVGLPNAGKSTLLARLTGAHPKIAAYPFTTLHPNLGVAEVDGGRTLVLADVPGLIEGAHRGVGLGMDFLRHLDRTRVLVHLVDAGLGEEAALAAIADVSAELSAFSAALGSKPTVLVFSKLDTTEARAQIEQLTAAMPHALTISAATGEGCEQLLDSVSRLVTLQRLEAVRVAPAAAEPGPRHRDYHHVPRSRLAPVVVPESGGYRVHHEATEQLVEITDMESEEAVMRLQRRMRRVGIDAALADAGCVEGDTVRLGEAEFVFTNNGGEAG